MTDAQTTEILATAAALEAQGRWAEALDCLASAVRRVPDPVLEVALADRRHRSWTHLTSGEGLPPLAEATECPPIGDSGLPEASLDDLDGPAVRSAIVRHGSLLVRKAIDADGVDRLREAVDQSFAYADRDPDDRDDPGWYHPLKLDDATATDLKASRLDIPRVFARDAGGVLLSDTPRAMALLTSMYEDLGLFDITVSCLGDRPVMSALKCTLRKVGLDAVGGWHQDGAFLGRDVRALNMWLTLSPCGVDAPGLDIVPKRFDEIVETGTHGSYFDWAVGDGLIEEVAGPEGTIRPVFEPGDLMLADQMMLHRTAVDPAMTKTRHAIEFWCFAASAYPETHVPLVW